MDKKVPSEFEMAYRARDSRARRRAWTQPGMWVERDRVRPLVDAWIARHDAVSELGGTSRAFSGLNRLAFEAGVTTRTIVADPPWPFQWGGGKGGRRRRETELGYKTMTVDEIAALDVAAFAHPEGCNLFLWSTDEVYREGQAVKVARAWGFEPVGPSIIWAKDNFGTGLFPRPAHEPLLVCRTRGAKAIWNDVRETRATHSVQRWSQVRGSKNTGKQHSRKPEGAGDLIERVSPGPYLELFARRTRLGWDSWGDQGLSHVDVAVSVV